MDGYSQQDKKCPTLSGESDGEIWPTVSAELSAEILSTLSMESQPPSKGERGTRYEVDISKLVMLNEVKHPACERDAMPHADGTS